MIISQIAAVAKNGIIGSAGTLPWHVPEDLQRFKALTMNKTVIMGRKTFEGLPKRLEGRRMIVLSRTLETIEGAEIAKDFEHALSLAKDAPEVVIAGGETLYRATMDRVHRIYLTHLDIAPEGDAQYPLEALEGFQLVHQEIHEHPQIIAFATYHK